MSNDKRNSTVRIQAPLPLDGSKSFRIYAIDIHTIENGLITEVHHIEDWVAAMKQLKS